MGCLISCLRIKSDDRRKNCSISARVDPRTKDPLVQKNDLTSVLLHKEEGAYEEEENLDSPGNIDRELKHEANFLISCGTLLETPIEFRKASEKIAVQTFNEDNLSSNVHLPEVPNTSSKKLDWDEPDNEISDSTAKLHEDPSYPTSKSECSKFQEHDKLRKFVNFEEVKDVSGDESVSKSTIFDISPSHTDGQTQSFDSGNSPYPTPLNLVDEMQTPGTVYPATTENLRTGKKMRIRTQYVFPILKPVENSSQWKAMREDSYTLDRLSEYPEQKTRSSSTDSRENVQQTPVPKNLKFSASPRISSINAKGIQIDETILKEKYASIKTTGSIAQPLDSTSREGGTQLLVTSLSQWLKPPSLDDAKEDRSYFTKESDTLVNYSDINRPILGAIAANWNHEEPYTVSPKRWDGNGIPNTTTKYKEDQKVSWHATPFEVRLDKALSDEKLFPQRKIPHGRPIKFDEGEEGNTETS